MRWQPAFEELVRWRTANSLRIQLRIPVEVIQPAVVQIVRREQAAVAMELVHGRGEGVLARKHPCLHRREIALAQVTGRACRDHVLPGGLAAFAAWDDVIEGEVFGRTAILAGETITQEDVESGEGGMGG